MEPNPNIDLGENNNGESVIPTEDLSIIELALNGESVNDNSISDTSETKMNDSSGNKIIPSHLPNFDSTKTVGNDELGDVKDRSVQPSGGLQKAEKKGEKQLETVSDAPLSPKSIIEGMPNLPPFVSNIASNVGQGFGAVVKLFNIPTSSAIYERLEKYFPEENEEKEDKKTPLTSLTSLRDVWDVRR